MFKAKITPEQREEIAKRYVEGGELGKVLAMEFGIQPNTVSQIVNKYLQVNTVKPPEQPEKCEPKKFPPELLEEWDRVMSKFRKARAAG